jgi:preprotein translocase SecE subunit
LWKHRLALQLQCIAREGRFLLGGNLFTFVLIFMGLVDYLRDTKGELKHVNWPTRRPAVGFTVMVILISLFIGFGLGLLDYGFTGIVKRFI